MAADFHNEGQLTLGCHIWSSIHEEPAEHFETRDVCRQCVQLPARMTFQAPLLGAPFKDLSLQSDSCH